MKSFKPLITGTDYVIKLIYTDTEKLPINITGSTAVLVLKKTIFDVTPITVNAVIAGVSGEIAFTIPSTDTVSLLEDAPSEKYYIGAVLTLSDGTVKNLFQTKIDIQQNIVTP